MEDTEAPEAGPTTGRHLLATAGKVAAWTIGCGVALLVCALGAFMLLWWAVWHGTS